MVHCSRLFIDFLLGVPIGKLDENVKSEDRRSRRGHRHFREQITPLRRLRQYVTTTFGKACPDAHYTENIEISDYLQEGDVGFKKPKVSST